MKLIVGLGNPGEKYAKTRHNLGFMVVEKLGSRVQGIGDSWKLDKKFKSEVLQINYTLDPNPYTLILVKPQTYMNNSGLAVKALVDYFKVPLEDVIIVYDELDLPLGKIKVRMGGAAAGHHGIESIMEALNDEKFIRVRLGIGNNKTQQAEHKNEHINIDHFVTEEFKHDEQTKVKHMIKQAQEAIDILLEKGLPEAQNQFN